MMVTILVDEIKQADNGSRSEYARYTRHDISAPIEFAKALSEGDEISVADGVPNHGHGGTRRIDSPFTIKRIRYVVTREFQHAATRSLIGAPTDRALATGRQLLSMLIDIVTPEFDVKFIGRIAYSQWAQNVGVW